MNRMFKMFITFWIIALHVVSALSSNFVGNKPFAAALTKTAPHLVLISGCTGTGKSTFGMEVAMSQGILKCISTDTIRQVMRGFIDDPALHRSSFAGQDDAVVNWMECCNVLKGGVEGIVKDSIKRGTSLVLEGVHIVPGPELIDLWESSGGVAVGCVLTITDANIHRDVIERRGELTKKGASGQLNAIPRIRAIHDEMLRLGVLHNWLVIEQRPRLTASPISMLQDCLQDRYLEGNFEMKK